jgi:hypothetical protein
LEVREVEHALSIFGLEISVVRVSAREHAAEVRVPLVVLDVEQHAPELAPDDEAHRGPLARELLARLHRANDPVEPTHVRDADRVVAELGGAPYETRRRRGALQEREARTRLELDVSRSGRKRREMRRLPTHIHGDY